MRVRAFGVAFARENTVGIRLQELTKAKRGLFSIGYSMSKSIYLPNLITGLILASGWK